MKLELKVTFKYRDGYRDPFDPSQTLPIAPDIYRWMICRLAFIRTQTRAFVSRVRSELLGQAPHVTLETNAERDGFQVRVKRLSSMKVLYKFPESRLQGMASIYTSQEDHEYCHGYWPTLDAADEELWDGTILDDYV